MFIAGEKNLFHNSKVALYRLVIGNICYYVIGITLASLLKDNRAFCKYICPVPVLQKLTSRFFLFKIAIDGDRCSDCYLCEENCPMGIELLKYKNENKRVLSTECILCNSCSEICPEEVVEVTIGFDCNKGNEYLKYSNDQFSNINWFNTK